VKNLMLFNKALLGKRLWRFMQEELGMGLTFVLGMMFGTEKRL